MLLCGINDNILIPHPSYSGVYQDETKKVRNLSRYKYVLGVEPNKENWKTVVHFYLSTLDMYLFLSDHYIFERGLGVMG